MANEFLRQSLHLVSGIIAAGIAYLFGQGVFLIVCFAVLAGGFVFSRLPSPLVVWAATTFDREEPYVGRGAYLMLFGAILTALLFPEQLVAAMLVVGIADSLATLAGMYAGTHPLPHNASSTYEGSLTFFVFSAVILWLFTPWALLVAAVLTLVESVEYQGHVLLDDNLLIPLVAGLLLFVL